MQRQAIIIFFQDRKTLIASDASDAFVCKHIRSNVGLIGCPMESTNYRSKVVTMYIKHETIILMTCMNLFGSRDISRVKQ